MPLLVQMSERLFGVLDARLAAGAGVDGGEWCHEGGGRSALDLSRAAFEVRSRAPKNEAGTGSEASRPAGWQLSRLPGPCGVEGIEWHSSQPAMWQAPRLWPSGHDSCVDDGMPWESAHAPALHHACHQAPHSLQGPFAQGSGVWRMRTFRILCRNLWRGSCSTLGTTARTIPPICASPAREFQTLCFDDLLHIIHLWYGISLLAIHECGVCTHRD